MSKEQTIINLLIGQKKTLAAAESCTGGLLCHRLTNVPGSSKVLHLGICTYSNESKIRLLGIPSSLIKTHGAVSEEAATLMAENVRNIQNSDYGIGITGIAGPEGGTKPKPVGLVFIALATRDEKLCLECRFRGERASVKKQAADQAMDLLLEFLA